MNQWEVVIGIETHAQLATVSKIFSGAATAFGAEPNTQASAIDLAFPGVLQDTSSTAARQGKMKCRCMVYSSPAGCCRCQSVAC